MKLYHVEFGIIDRTKKLTGTVNIDGENLVDYYPSLEMALASVEYLQDKLEESYAQYHIQALTVYTVNVHMDIIKASPKPFVQGADTQILNEVLGKVLLSEDIKHERTLLQIEDYIIGSVYVVTEAMREDIINWCINSQQMSETDISLTDRNIPIFDLVNKRLVERNIDLSNFDVDLGVQLMYYPETLKLIEIID